MEYYVCKIKSLGKQVNNLLTILFGWPNLNIFLRHQNCFMKVTSNILKIFLLCGQTVTVNNRILILLKIFIRFSNTTILLKFAFLIWNRCLSNIRFYLVNCINTSVRYFMPDYSTFKAFTIDQYLTRPETPIYLVPSFRIINVFSLENHSSMAYWIFYTMFTHI